jgi:hypothetical protein
LPTTVTRARVDQGGLDGGVVAHDQLDPALGGLGGLAEQQRDQHRLLDDGQELVGEALSGGEFGGGELDRGVRPAELDQGDHGVEPVGRLVRLRLERLGQAAHRVQLAGQGLELGVVAQRRHGPERAPLPGHRGLVDHDDRLAGEVDLVVRIPAGGEQLAQGSGHVQLGGGAALGVGLEPEQPGTLVVDQQRAERSQAKEQGDQTEQGWHLPGQLGGDLGLGDADGDQPLDRPALAGHWHDGPDRRAEGAGEGLGEGLAGQRWRRVPDEAPADQGRVRVRVAHPVAAHHDHEVDPVAWRTDSARGWSWAAGSLERRAVTTSGEWAKVSATPRTRWRADSALSRRASSQASAARRVLNPDKAATKDPDERLIPEPVAA